MLPIILLINYTLLFQSQAKYPIAGYWGATARRTTVRIVEGHQCRLDEDESWDLAVEPDDSRFHELTYSRDEFPSSKSESSACYENLVVGQEVKVRILHFDFSGKDTYQFIGRIHACRGCDPDGAISRGRDVNGSITRINARKIRIAVDDLGSIELKGND